MTTALPLTDRITFPALFMDREQWENLSHKLADPFFQRLHERNLGVLQRLSEREQRTQRRALKRRIERSVAAWYLTREERWLQMAVRALEACCREDEQWRVTDESTQMIRAANLATGELLYNVAFGYDALYPYLSEEQRRMCLEALIEKGLDAYLKGVELEDWWVRCDFNWNSALHGNAGVAAMAVRNEDRDLSDRVLEKVLEGLPHLCEAFYPDGGYIEGVMYFHTAVGHLTDFVAPYYRLTGEDLGLLQNADFHDTLTWKMYMEGGDGRTYNFSDVGEGRGPAGQPQTYWWARMLDRPDWTGDTDRRIEASEHTGGLWQDVESFWYREPFQPGRRPDLKRLRHFSGIDWLTWRGEKTWLAFRSGFNGGNHDNDDLGNFILGFGDERFLCDPGYGPKDASQHNCITVRHFEQTDCATARIERLEELERGFYLKCNIQEAFPHVCDHYDRHLLLTDDRHLLLTDDVAGVNDIRTTVRSHLQTRLPFWKTEEGWCIEGRESRLRVIHLTESGFFRSWEWQPKKGRDKIGTLSWKNAHDAVHTVQVTLLTFGDPEVAFHRSDEELEVALEGRTYRFTELNGRFEFAG